MLDKSATKMLRLVEAMANGTQPHSVTALAKELDLTKTNVHRILKTLIASGYVRRHTETARYELTLKLWELGAMVVERSSLRRESVPFLSALAKDTGGTAHLCVPDGLDVVYLESIDHREVLRNRNAVGVRVPMYCVASGRAILAYYDEEIIDTLAGSMTPFTDRTITDIGLLKRELQEVREFQYARYQSEWRSGVNGVAACIRQAGGEIIGAISISGADDQIKPDDLPRLGGLIVRTANKISSLFGYTDAANTQVGDFVA